MNFCGLTFSVPVENEIKNFSKIGKQIEPKIVSYKLQFIVSVRFIASSLSYLVDNPAEGTHKTKTKQGHDSENVKNVKLSTKIASATLYM